MLGKAFQGDEQRARSADPAPAAAVAVAAVGVVAAVVVAAVVVAEIVLAAVVTNAAERRGEMCSGHRDKGAGKRGGSSQKAPGRRCRDTHASHNASARVWVSRRQPGE